MSPAEPFSKLDAVNLRIFDSTSDLISAAASTILQRVEGGARSIALSGGSTPQPLYEMLGASPLRERLAEFPITWVIVDERYVPFNDPQSNAGMIARTLFASGMSDSHRFLRFDTEIDDPAATTARFEAQWGVYEIDTLDLVLLGIGDDGHTASLFPGTPVLDVEDRIAAEVFVPRLSQWRVTITKPVIRAGSLRMVLATGESKAPILQGVASGVEYPIAQATNGVETWWFVDRSAAEQGTS
jgi:6-phosphogluconolactonase